MNTYNICGKRSGSAILITMILTFVVAIMVAGAILIVEHEHKFSVMSSNRAQTLHTAEAGIDFAIAALQEQIQYGYDWEDNGWLIDGSVMSQTDIELKPTGHAAPDSEFSIQLDTNTMVATASGTMAEPGTTGTITRTVQVELEPDWMYRFEKGLLGKDELTFQGGPVCDSYNSNDGPYGGLNVLRGCDIGSMKLSNEGIAGGGTPDVYGDVYVTEVGDAVGDFWSGDEFDTLDVDIPPAKIPNPADDGKVWEVEPAWTGNSPAITVSNETRYIVVDEVDAKGGDKDILIQGSGEVIILVQGPFVVGTPSSMTILPDPVGSDLKVKIVVDGPSIDMLGDLNYDGKPVNLIIEGTDNCLNVKVTANDAKSLCVYAPNAEFALGGGGTVFGSMVGKELTVDGTFDFHYDESLATNDAPVLAGFVIKSWQEL